MRVGDQRRNNLNSLPETAHWKDLVLFLNLLFPSFLFINDFATTPFGIYLSREESKR
jgi:hypothetical protein